ncbi:MAG TPA: right-handed parallel beta-helix repeat-containing protein, partial [Candidatus Kapabacteria bacterium]|nr:right-handed parallel beta-helix repeat-containing protein [Candidatus Kapabacteria bacterium]
MVRKVFVALFRVLGALPLFAAKYYIDPNLGVDVRTKTQAQLFYYPWKHIQTGIDSANVGDTISLADAPFPESITITKRICIFGRVSTVSIINYPASAGTGTVVTIAPGVDGVYLKNLAIDGRYQFANGALNGVVCGVGVDSLRMTSCAIRNCGASGVLASFDATADGAVNEGFHIENCSFQNILAGQGTALHSCAIWGDHLSHAYIRANTFYKCGIGIWISGTTYPDTSAGTGNVISSNAIHDLTQNGLIAAGIYNSVIDSNVVERCAGFIRPDSAWSRMYVGSVSFVGGATNVTMIDNVVRDNNGYIGIDTFYTDQVADTVETPGYNGWPGMFFRGSDTVVIHHGSIFGNNFGGMYISGNAPHVTIDSCFFYSNGNLNDSNEDYAISAPFAKVDARSNWWGVSTGPVFDGNGVGNGIYGDSITVDPVM